MTRHSFIIMEQLGQTLQHYLTQRGKAFSLKTVCQLGIRLIQQFEELHKIGKIYNDLKLDNVIVGDCNGTFESLSDIRLIDFGLCTDYLDPNGNHIEMANQSTFHGNMAMGSVNAMNFKSVSRRDDLISLTYLLVYMIQGNLGMLNVSHLDKRRQFEHICKAKNQLTPDQLCKSARASCLLPFVSVVHSLSFKERPDYDKLR